ncbi:hypothetical protein [Paraburkholderia aromaticivorans]|uniref:hypothetical protein n=1 Tax=Paraburkholderia aromaticivorans TaxID=2026199 RepID=UPI0014561873|nr:hypothetical protein [Paraburkholderia aromaticivorans]
MKRLSMLLAAGLVAAVALVGCSSTPTEKPSDPTQTPAQILAAVKANVTKACNIAQPTLASVKAMTPTSATGQQAVLAKLTGGASDICSANAAADPSSVQNFVQSIVPDAIAALEQLKAGADSVTAAKYQTWQIAIIAFQTTLSAAIQQYGTSTAPTSPAPVAASGTVAS